MAVQSFSTLYRDFVTDGVPTSGTHNPIKADIRSTFETLFGASSTTVADVKTHLGLGDFTIDNGSTVFIDRSNNNVSFGDAVRPDNYIDLGAALIQGLSNVLFGSDILTTSNALAHFCTFIGPSAAEGANNLYCCDGHGLRVLTALVDGQYVGAFGCDAGLHVTYGRNTVIGGAKGGLYKVDLRDSVIMGVSAAYGGGDVNNSIIIGVNACDAGQPASFAVADADHHDVSDNVVVGNYAGRFLTGQYSVLLGNNAGSLTDITGNFNLGIGRSAFGALTSGLGNVAIGDSAGGITSTGNYNIHIGFQVQPPSGGAGWNNTVALGYQSGASLSGDNQVQIGSSGQTVYTQSAVQTRSDARDKADVEDCDLGLGFILKLRPVRYRLDQRERYVEMVPVLDADGNHVVDSSGNPQFETVDHIKDASRASARISYGLIAQDVGRVVNDLGVNFAGWQDHSLQDAGRDVQSLAYEQFIGPMIKAIQDLSAANDNVSRDIKSIRRQGRDLVKRFDDHEARIAKLESELATLKAA